MALVLADRVKETTTSTGTTAITLAGAATGYQAFSAAIGNANSTYYTIADQSGANWEVGIGTYTSAGNTLSRDTVLSSSNAGSLVTFTAGTKDVYVTYPSERAVVGTKTISNKTGAYTVVAGDLGKILNCTNATAYTLSLTAAATLGAGFTCTIWNTGTSAANVITIDPNGTETIDGVATLSLSRGEGMDIVCDGTNWQTSYKKTMRGYAENCVSSMTRPVATTGSNAIAIGNSYASGADSFAVSIANNTNSYGALATSAIAIGRTAQAIGAGSVAIGGMTGAVSAGTGSICLNTDDGSGGYTSLSSGISSVAIGRGNRSVESGKYTFASGWVNAQGDSQFGTLVIRAATTTTTAVALTSNGSAAGTTNQVVLRTSQAMTVSGTLIAKQTATGNIAAYTITGAAVNNAGTMGSTGLALTLIGSDSIVLDAAPTITLDTTNKAVKITSGYKAATNIQWVAVIQTTEVLY